jgi:predicted CopG family antitoxin
MNMKTIRVSQLVYDHLVNSSTSVKDTMNNILERLLKLKGKNVHKANTRRIKRAA